MYLLALWSSPSTFGQVPQGFNYQAIARDGDGNLITTPFEIRIKIQNFEADTVFWNEQHSVTPNEYGLISFIVGKGTPLAGRYCQKFEDIDWTSRPRFIKTMANTGSGYVVMGITKIMSVPYSLVAKEVTGPIDNLDIVGTTDLMDEALFEVRNKNGQTIFAVYNQGVRIYVDDTEKGPKGGFAIGGFGTEKGTSQPYFIVKPDTVRVYINQSGKGVKGGFAIGGYGTDKADPQNFLFVSDDSVRIYIDNADDDIPKGVKGGFAIGGYGTSKGDQKFLTVSDDSVRIYINDTGKSSKGGFAIGGFGTTKGMGKSFLNVETSATGIIDPPVNRILWYPLKNSFLAGQIHVASPTDVGENSFATGYQAMAKGMYSQSMGYLTSALGNYSTAIGKSSTASYDNSFAFGDNAKALNQDSYAFGAFTEAQGIGSFAFGYVGRDSLGPTGTVTKALGNYSFAFGLGAQTEASAEGAFAIGSETSASGNFSLAMGYKSSASDYYSVAIGSYAQASLGSTAIGASAKATGTKSLALLGSASGTRSINIGTYSTASGYSAIAIGGYYYHQDIPISITTRRNAYAEGERSIAIGSGVRALGDWSLSIGNGNYGELLPPVIYGSAEADYSCAIGSSNRATATSAYAIGNSNLASGNYSFALGTSTTSSGSYTTAIGYNNLASGYYAVALGRNTTAQAYNSTVIGRYNVIEGTTNSWVSDEPLFVIGNGSSTSVRSNAFSVRKDGFTEITSTLRVTGFNQAPSSGTGVEIAYLGSVGLIQAVDRSTGTAKPLSIYSGIVQPIADNTYACGNSGARWTAVYAANGTIQTSDRRLKEDIQVLAGGLNTILELNPVTFKWKNHTDIDRHIGLIAQEVQPLIPEVVNTGDDPDKTLGINYAGLVPVLISAIKEQQEQIDELKALVEQLMNQ
jgi:hypothetical protein